MTKLKSIGVLKPKINAAFVHKIKQITNKHEKKKEEEEEQKQKNWLELIEINDLFKRIE